MTSGGPASFIMPLQIGKIPIVVPRQKQYDEHVNDHQVDFTKAVAERMGTIIPVTDIDDLQEIIVNYDAIVGSMPSEMKSNNKVFNDNLEKIVTELMKK
ncbi:glycosyltransferase [Floccifex sp.]|uniref:glycosyltransferase n=1 Tax=Floccifex sp. TaxID=2815810 RepID=UPI003F115CDA